jgi:protocatechuate 3,4-dioxygenase beta subunit
MSPRQRLFGLGALLLLAAAVLWIAGGAGPGDEGEERDAPVLRRASAAANGAAASSTAAQGAPGAGDAGASQAAPDDGRSIALLDPATPAAVHVAAPVAVAPEFGESVFRGRIVDDAGQPIALATIVYWPNEVSQALYGLDTLSSGAALDVLPRASSASDGRFEVRGLHREGFGITGMYPWPCLVVLAGDLAIRVQACEGFHGGDFDAGDIALEPGAPLSGRVVDDSGRPVAGAFVVPWSPTGRSLRGVLKGGLGADGLLIGFFAATATDGSGRFRTGALWDGSTELVLTASGFTELRLKDVPVTAGSRNDLGDLVLGAAALLAGRVQNAGGEPVAGARVLAWNAELYGLEQISETRDAILDILRIMDDQPDTRTDAAGRFALQTGRAGTHHLIVDAPGFEPLAVGEVLPGAGELKLTLARAATLRLVLQDAASFEPVRGAQVTARRRNLAAGGAQGQKLPVRADSAPGTFLVERIGRLRTELTVEAPGYATTILSIPGAQATVMLERREGLVREAAVSGRVTDAQGTPLGQATVVARWVHDDPDAPASVRLSESGDMSTKEDGPGTSAAGGWPPGERAAPLPVQRSRVQGLTDAQGGYVLGTLSPGEWVLRADGEGFGAEERAVAVGPEQDTAQVDFTLLPAASVFGHSLDEDGSPLRQKQMFFWRDPQDRKGQEPAREFTPDAQGRYEVRDLRPGTWSLMGQGLEFTLAPGERRELDFRRPPIAGLTGRVLDAGGAPVPDAWVLIGVPQPGSGDSVPHSVRADARGEYAWKQHQLGPRELIATTASGSGASEPVPVELEPGEQRRVDLRLGGLVVRGVVRRGDGAAVTGASVRILPAGGGGRGFTVESGGVVTTFGSVSCDADGRFEMRDLTPGEYVASAKAPGFRSESELAFALGASAVPELELRVEATGSIVGTARRASGVPVKNATAVMGDAPGQHAWARTDVGAFELEELGAGTWRIFIEELGSVAAERTVVLAPGERVRVELIVP